jgi:outer membrane protein
MPCCLQTRSQVPPQVPLQTHLKARSVVRAVAACALAFTVNAKAADLLDIYRQALVNDPVFASARAAAVAGQEKAVQGRAALLPTVAVTGSLAGVSQESPVRDVDFRSRTYSISLSQPLFRPANWAAYQQGLLSVALSEAQLALVRQELILRVSQAYFDVLAARDVVAFIEAQQAAITEQLASAKRNFEVGTATITDTNEAQARYDLAVAQAIAARNALEVRQAALQQIIGDSPKELAPLRVDVTLKAPQPADMTPWVDSAEQFNTTVVAEQIELEIAQQDIKRNRAGHYPTVDLVASRGRSNQTATTFSNIGGTTESSSIGVQWAIPLFSGFSVDSRVREAIALEDRAHFDLATSRRAAAQNARQSFLGVSNGLAQVRALEAAERSSQSALESNQLGYQVGVRINIDVLNAQQQLFSARRDLAQARYDTILNGLRLEAAAGTLEEDDVMQTNTLLDTLPK